MFRNFGAGEILLILVVVLLLFGAKRLPDAARGLGRSLRIFKSEVSAMGEDAPAKDSASKDATGKDSAAKDAGSDAPKPAAADSADTDR
jgi:sec-independent protein translocase protein TatA